MVTTAQYVNDMQAVVRTVNDLSHRVRELEAVELPLGGGVPAHTILDASVHTDTALDAVSRGSLIYGNSTPLWDELVHPGKANHVLISDANDVLWSVHTIDISGDSEIAGTLIGGGMVDTATFTGTIPVTGTFAMGAGTVTSITTNDTTIANHTHALDNTGVVAAVYGSATQVPQLTVDAKGRLTLVANVLITGVTPAAHAPSHEVGGSDLVNHDNLTGFVANEHINHTAVTITAGAGLTGGGDISASRTLNVGAGNGITVNANDVALTTPGDLTYNTANNAAGNHTHAITNSYDGVTNTNTILRSGNGTDGIYLWNIQVVDSLIHYNDIDTYIEFFTDGINLYAGGALMMQCVEGADDYINLNQDTRIVTGKYFGVSGADVRFEFDSTSGYIDAILGDAAGSDEFRVVDSGGAAVVTADSNGNGYFAGDVGIGIAIPGELLHLQNTGANVYTRLDSGTGANYYVSGIQLRHDDTNRWILYKNNNSDADFLINRYSDAGAFQGTALRIYRSTGYVRTEDRLSVGTATDTAQLYVDQSSTTTAVPVLTLDQGNTSEQCINVRSDGSDRDIHILTVEVTGTPAIDWNESGNAFSVSKSWYINETSNANMITGITIKESSSAHPEAFTLKHPDVNHGITNITETDTYCYLHSANDNGQATMWGLTADQTAIKLAGVCTNEDTTDDANSDAVIELDAYKKDGTGITSLGNTANLVAIENNELATHLFKGNGDIYIAGAVTENDWDEHNDVGLLHGLRAFMSPVGSEIRKRFGEWIEYARPILEQTGVITYSKDGRYMQSLRGMQILTIDALRQAYQRINTLELEIQQLKGDL